MYAAVKESGARKTKKRGGLNCFQKLFVDKKYLDKETKDQEQDKIEYEIDKIILKSKKPSASGYCFICFDSLNTVGEFTNMIKELTEDKNFLVESIGKKSIIDDQHISEFKLDIKKVYIFPDWRDINWANTDKRRVKNKCFYCKRYMGMGLLFLIFVFFTTPTALFNVIKAAWVTNEVQEDESKLWYNQLGGFSYLLKTFLPP